MDIKAYKSITKDMTATLLCGEELKLSYYPNHLTGERIEALAKKAADSANKPLVQDDEDGLPRLTLQDMYEDYIDHLAASLHSIDLTDGGKPLPFKEEESKKKALRHLSYDDVQGISKQIGEDINAPLEKTGTDSSPGQAQRDE